MRIAFLQIAPIRGEPSKNLEAVLGHLGRAESDLVVLPELCLTGYMFRSREEAGRLAEDVPGGATRAIADLCGRRGMHVVMGLAERTGARLFNSAVLVGPGKGGGEGGVIATYRKTHLFDREKEIFDPGDTGFAVHDVPGARVGMLVCFDWMFPEAARTLALMGADVIAHPSNLVLPWAQAAVVTRCVENRVYWVLANRTGEETEGGATLSFTGASRIVAPGGAILLDAGEGEDRLGVVDVDLAAARDKKVNATNDVLGDRRPDLYRG